MSLLIFLKATWHLTKKKPLISQTDGNKGGNGNSRQDVPSHHMQYSLLLQISLVTDAKKGQLCSPTIICDPFQWDFERTSNPTTCQKPFQRNFFGDGLSTLLPPGYRRHLDSCPTACCNAHTAAAAPIVLN